MPQFLITHVYSYVVTAKNLAEAQEVDENRMDPGDLEETTYEIFKKGEWVKV